MDMTFSIDVHEGQEEAWNRHRKNSRTDRHALESWGEELIRQGEKLVRLAEIFKGKRLAVSYQFLAWDINYFNLEGNQEALIAAWNEDLIDGIDLGHVETAKEEPCGS